MKGHGQKLFIIVTLSEILEFCKRKDIIMRLRDFVRNLKRFQSRSV